ncbi:preprotein translocase subunit SecE [Desulfolucanica intricata]|uniref:preprotein translocase subunit SecE n=1 Tax=Desulfolucanica intricata TaxID=1285191 RepID=UPI000B1A7695|nr:preprotein translocase subunit SecE [Desulfolucanica intricata]
MALSKDTKKRGAAKDTKGNAVHRENTKKNKMKKTDVVAKESPQKSLPAKRETAKVSRIQGIQKFFRGVLSELKKVHWPSRRETLVYTLVVLVSVSFVAVLIWIFDSVFSQVLQLVL